MNEILPTQVDVWTLCKKGVNAKGAYPLNSLEQLQGKIAPCEKNVEASFVFMMDSKNLPIVEVRWEADINVICERCLSTFELPMKAMNTLCVVNSYAASKTIPEGYDPVVVPKDSMLSVSKLLSEEILLSLPLIIRHDNVDCSKELLEIQSKASQIVEEKKPSPFSELSNLNS